MAETKISTAQNVARLLDGQGPLPESTLQLLYDILDPKSRDPKDTIVIPAEDGGIHAYIAFHHGPRSQGGRQGTDMRAVINAIKDRLAELNAEFPCRENSIAITKLEEAVHRLEDREKDGVKRGVEGKNKA